MPGHPYVGKLPDGRYFSVELPPGSADVDPLTGELILQPPAIHLLDRLRTLFVPLPANATSARIRILREALGVSQTELADLLNLDVSAVSAWESGAARPGGEDLLRLEALRSRALRGGIAMPDAVRAS